MTPDFQIWRFVVCTSRMSLVGLVLGAIALRGVGGDRAEKSPPCPEASTPHRSQVGPGIAREFPLTVKVTKSEVNDSTGNLLTRLKGEQMGMAPPIWVDVTATINGEFHWWLQCLRENSFGQTNPCTQLEPGQYPGRWVHNGELLQIIVMSEEGKLDLRFLDVVPNRKDPPSPSDPVTRSGRYMFQFSVPEGHSLQEYPVLLHVYGAVRLNLPKGISPTWTHCTSTAYTQFSAAVSCINFGGKQLYKGYVTLNATLDGTRGWNISCEAKWRSKCAALGPGFYPARWLKDKRERLVVVVVIDEKPREIVFDATRFVFPDVKEPAPARPPSS